MSIHQPNFSQDQLIRPTACARMLNISKSALYDWLNPQSPRFKSDFPRRVQLSARVIGWRLSELNAWIQTKQQGLGGSL